MEFINALPDIIKKNSIVLSDADADKKISLAFETYCQDDNDYLQLQEYRNILACNVLLANLIFGSYLTSKKNNDKHYKALADRIETISDTLEKNNISCFSYSYFIYAFLKYLMEALKDKDFKQLGIEPVRWLKAGNYDLSDNYNVTNEETFGFGKYKDTIKSFAIDTGTLEKYKGKSSYVIIPNFVTSIGSEAFANDKNIRTLYIPDSVTAIDVDAFLNCVNLETVILSKKIVRLPSGVFNGCTKLKKINLQKIEFIGARCFKDCTSLSEVDLPSLNAVGAEAFANCCNLNKYDFISNLQEIGEEAFNGCSMDYVTLKRCKYLGENAFLNCTDIARITIESSIPSLGKTPFNGCNSVNYVRLDGEIGCQVHQLFSEDIDSFNSNIKELTCIKKSKLYDNDFDGYLHVTDIEIFNENKIPVEAFKDCSNLKNIKFDKDIESIGDSAFENCSSLSSIEINYLGTSVAKKAFYKCESLKSFDFLANCVSFEEMAMAYDDLTNFSFDRKFSFIGAFAFANCKYPIIHILDLKNAKVFPAAFHGVRKIMTLVLSTLKNIYGHQLYYLFENSKEAFNSNSIVRYVFIKDTLEKGSFKNYRNIRYVEFDVDNETGTIPEEAFKDSAIESIKVNGTVNTIEKSAFNGCHKLVTLNMSYEKLKVMDYAFAGCKHISDLISFDKICYLGCNSFEDTDITDLVLSNNVKFIGKGAFAKCNQLTSLTLPFTGNSSNPLTEEERCFGYIFSDSIDESCNIQKVHIDDNDIEFYIPSSVQQATILSKSLGKNSFKNCYFIKQINLPNIKVLAEEIFAGCKNLTSLIIGDKLEVFSALSVLNCPSLTNIEIASNCQTYQTINGSVFSKDGRTIYYLSENTDLNDYISKIDEIESGAIQNCPKSLSLHGNTFIHKYAIDGTNLKELSLDNIAACEPEAIFSCNGLKVLHLSGNVAKGIISTDQSITIDQVYIDGLVSNEIISVFDENTCININNLDVHNVRLEAKLFRNILSITDLKCPYDFESSMKGLFGTTIVKNIEMMSLRLPLVDLFASSDLCKNIRKVVIANGNVIPFMFSGCVLDSLTFNEIGSVAKNGFAHSEIHALNISKIGTIETGAFNESKIDGLIINDPNFQMIDSVLYEKEELIYCFDKTKENFTVPTFVKHIRIGALSDILSLKKLVIDHQDIFIDNRAIINCPNLNNLELESINNSTIKEILDNPSSITSITFTGESVKDKYFCGLSSLTSISMTRAKYLGDFAFADDISLESVDLSHIKRIGDLAFYNCKNIKKIQIDSYCEHIGLSAFEGCDSLEEFKFAINEYQIENDYKLSDILGKNHSSPSIIVKSDQFADSYFEGYSNTIEVINKPAMIGNRAFASAKVDIDLSEAISIGDNAFENSTITFLDLKNAEIIGSSAFESCKKLNQIKIGSKLTSIGNDWIKNSPICLLSVDPSNANYKSINNCLIDKKEGNKLIYAASANEKKELVFDSSVEAVASYAFSDSNAQSITINGTKTLEEKAFANCSNLISLNLHNINLIKGSIIGGYNIQSLSVDEISINGSTKLSGLFINGKIPNSLRIVSIDKKISPDNFDKLNEIEVINVPKDLNKIPNGYFSNCNSLSSFILPDSCRSIGEDAFKGCSHLKNLNPKAVTSFGKNAFAGCTFDNIELPFIGKSIKEPKRLQYLFGDYCNIRNIAICGGKIVDNCFEGINTLEKVALLGKDIIEIGAGAFKDLISLIEVKGTDTLTKIGDYAFYNCLSLKEISLNSILYIGKEVFAGCLSIEKVCINSQVKHIEKEAFKECESIKEAVVPFNKHMNRLADYGFNTASLEKAHINAGEITNESFKGYSLSSLTLNLQINEIPSHMFENNQSLTEIIMPAVSKIGNYAFAKCPKLKQIDLSKVTTIGAHAFEGTLSGELILSSVQTIGDYAFSESSIESCDLGKCTTISKGAFENCKKLTSIDLTGIKSYGESAFENCTLLKNAKLNDDVKTLPARLFANTGLREINIPTHLCEIGDEVFAKTHMQNLPLHFPKSLVKVGKYVFADASSPIVFIYKGHDKAWNSLWRSNCIGHGFFWFNKKVKIQKVRDDKYE